MTQAILSTMADMLGRLESISAAGRVAFEGNLDLQDAALRRLQTLSESAQHLSEGLKKRHPEVPWKRIAGLRNRLVHAYLDIDLDIVWRTLEVDLSVMRRVVDREFARLRDEESREPG